MNSTTIKNAINETSPNIIFIIHGFVSSADDTWLQSIKENLLKYYAQINTIINVITVDWSILASPVNDYNNLIYTSSAKNTRDILAPSLRDLISPFQTKFVTCIGHSLGAQTCGAFGRLVSIDVIHGLDPAGPLFDNGLYDLINLNKGDATFVSVIHTDINILSNILGGVHFGTGVSK